MRLAQASRDTSCEDAKLVAPTKAPLLHNLLIPLQDARSVLIFDDICTDIILGQNGQNASFQAATNPSEICLHKCILVLQEVLPTFGKQW